MANRMLRGIVKERRREAIEAGEALREVFEEIGVPLPGLTIDPREPVTGDVRVSPGRIAANDVLMVVGVLRDGLAARDAAVNSVTPMPCPKVGDLVVDTAAGRCGTFQDVDGDRWRLAPVFGDGEPWTADPHTVRSATLNELVRVGMTAKVSHHQKAG
ncbi:hypothetical protein ACI1MP_12280 [Kitasatospora griseola]|uniref:hypothetical protein n=1 Tax=Kitasatospora TaxID=2063 RepID=UPI0009397E94|nr:hypothetical protein [Kitasatospora sp. CB01950]OKJ15964.1 hypothetical protein AMK19_07150 [Kitasatospora sp. CB01950]